MSDAEVRALERRWRETGAGDDEARWLAARVRTGELDGAWLEALAFFGHGPAVLAGGKAPDPWDLDDSNVWGAKLRPLGVPVVIRAALAAARLGVEPWERAHPGQPGRGPRPMLEAVEAWLACPCAEHAAAAKRAGEARDDDPIEVDDEDEEVEVPVRWAVSTAGRLGRALPAGTVAAATQALHSVARDLKRNVERAVILAAIRDALARVVQGQASAPATSAAVEDVLRADPAVVRFVVAVRVYLALVEGRTVGVADARPLAGALAELVAAALDLPDAEPTDAEDAPRPAELVDFAFDSLNDYREIFDPYGETAPVGGSLMDDLDDIRGDLREGLHHYELDTSEGTRDAVFSWRFDFESHWGEHATSALRALYWIASGRAERA